MPGKTCGKELTTRKHQRKVTTTTDPAESGWHHLQSIFRTKTFSRDTLNSRYTPDKRVIYKVSAVDASETEHARDHATTYWYTWGLRVPVPRNRSGRSVCMWSVVSSTAAGSPRSSVREPCRRTESCRSAVGSWPRLVCIPDVHTPRLC